MEDQEKQDKGVEETHYEQENEAQPKQDPQPPTHKMVEVACGNCGSEFALPVEQKVTGFKFNCTNCGAENTVQGV